MTLKGYQLSFVPDVDPYWIEDPEIIQTPSGTAKVTRTESIGQSQIIWADYGSGQEHPHQPEDVIVVHPPEQKPWEVGDRAIFNFSTFPEHVPILTVLAVGIDLVQVQNPIGNCWTEPIENLRRIDVTGFDDAKCLADLPELRFTTPPLPPKPHPPEQTTRDDVNPSQKTEKSNTKSGKRKRYPGKGKACGWIETRRTNRKREKPSTYLVYRWQDSEGKHSRYIPEVIAPKVRQMIAENATIDSICLLINQTRRERRR